MNKIINNNTDIINHNLEEINKLQKKHIKLYYRYISTSDKSILKTYFDISKKIKQAEHFLIENGINKEYYVFEVVNGRNKYNTIRSKLNYKIDDFEKLDYSFF